MAQLQIVTWMALASQQQEIMTSDQIAGRVNTNPCTGYLEPPFQKCADVDHHSSFSTSRERSPSRERDACFRTDSPSSQYRLEPGLRGEFLNQVTPMLLTQDLTCSSPAAADRCGLLKSGTVSSAIVFSKGDS